MSSKTMYVLNAMESFYQFNGQILDKISAIMKMYENIFNPENVAKSTSIEKKIQLLQNEVPLLVSTAKKIQSLQNEISSLINQDKLVDVIIPSDGFFLIISNILDAMKALNETDTIVNHLLDDDQSILYMETVNDKLKIVTNTIDQVEQFVNKYITV